MKAAEENFEKQLKVVNLTCQKITDEFSNEKQHDNFFHRNMVIKIAFVILLIRSRLIYLKKFDN